MSAYRQAFQAAVQKMEHAIRMIPRRETQTARCFNLYGYYPFADYHAYVGERSYRLPRTAGAQAFFTRMNAAGRLFLEGLPGALRARAAQVGGHKDCSYLFALPGQISFDGSGQHLVAGGEKITLNDFYGTETIKTLLDMAEEADIGIDMTFRRVPGMVESDMLIVTFDFIKPFDAAKYRPQNLAPGKDSAQSPAQG